jgi:hypothetical protein
MLSSKNKDRAIHFTPALAIPTSESKSLRPTKKLTEICGVPFCSHHAAGKNRRFAEFVENIIRALPGPYFL